MASVFAVEYDPGNYMDSAMAPAEATYKAKVMAHTWGHLAPTEDQRYRGYMIFTQGAYGDLILISTKWRGLDDSPWLFDDMMEFVEKRARVAGAVYKFTGLIRSCQTA
jgi:hypothetical protein